MSGFIEGRNRHQSTLFPERIDDYAEKDLEVRMLEAPDQQLYLTDL